MTSLNEEQAAFLLVVARRIVPEVAGLGERGCAQLLAIIDRTLMDRGAEVCRKFGVFLGVLRWVPALRYGRTFSGLRPERQDAVLRWFESAPLGLQSGGLWGLGDGLPRLLWANRDLGESGVPRRSTPGAARCVS
jgi:hypothetical protein